MPASPMSRKFNEQKRLCTSLEEPISAASGTAGLAARARLARRPMITAESEPINDRHLTLGEKNASQLMPNGG